MHEFGVIESLCRQVEEIAAQHKAEKVIRIVLEVGDLSHLTPEHLKETFLAVRTASPLLRDTDLEFRSSPGLHGEEIILRDVELEIPSHD